jgi:hypothetical protein
MVNIADSNDMRMSGDSLAIIKLLWKKLKEANAREVDNAKQIGYLYKQWRNTLDMWEKSLKEMKAVVKPKK